MVLVMLLAFIIRAESTAYPIIPKYLATLYVQHPQDSVVAITLVGSLLSLISTKYVFDFQFQMSIADELNRAFSEAVRFATVVSLGTPCSKTMSLYSLYAGITVGSGKTLFDFGSSRVHWSLISLVSLLLFTIQTAA
jgi:hypothetical protein